MNAVTKMPDEMNRSVSMPQDLARISESAAMLQMIERVVRDETISIDRLKAVLDLKEQLDMKAAKRLFDAAMSRTQSEMRSIGVDKDNSQTKSKYASYEALDGAVRPIYTKNGFSLVFDTAESPLEAHVRVICDVAHDDGYTRQFHIDMPADGKGAKGGDVMTKTHATGSALTYGQRYLLKMIFNIAVGVGAKDDDGNAASGREAALVTEEQIERLRSALAFIDGDEARFCKRIGVASLADIFAAKFDEALRVIKSRGNQ